MLSLETLRSTFGATDASLGIGPRRTEIFDALMEQTPSHTEDARVHDRRLFQGILFVFLALLVVTYVATTRTGLWEDGYFVLRFAYNFWHHGTFAWNPDDGPVYGMTSQTLQIAGAILYKLAPDHVVLTLKASLVLALWMSFWWFGKLARESSGAMANALPAFLGLSTPPVLALALTGLETTYALLSLAITIHVVLRFDERRASPWSVVLLCLLVYLTRPDAVLIVAVLLLYLSLHEPRRYALIAVATGAGLGAILLAFRAYYGTALPLPFYAKTQGIATQSPLYLALFAREKTKNIVQFLFIAAPFVWIAVHDRSRRVIALLCSAFAFVAYHYAMTIEVMGHFSRFYIPALAPLLAASTLAYPAFRRFKSQKHAAAFAAVYALAFVALKAVDETYRVPIMVPRLQDGLTVLGACVLLLTPRTEILTSALLCAAVSAGCVMGYPITAFGFETDKRILLRQIRPRRVFRHLPELVRRVPVKTLFHTDMGAPGVLLPEARVVDLDGLLNEQITLQHVRFEELCKHDHPEAIFVPSEGYAELRREVLSSECIKDYLPVDGRADSPLRIRRDLYPRFVHRALKNKAPRSQGSP